MARFINDDVKLKKGGRKAPKISIDELKEKLKDIYPVEVLCNPEDIGLEKDIKYNGMAMDEVFIESEYFDVAAIGESLVGYHTLDNGFTFLGIGGFSEWQTIAPMFTIAYWDGKKIRAYTPTYGNAVNTDFKCFYGQAYEYDDGDIDYEKLTKKYIKEGLLPKGTEVIEDVQIFEALYLMKYDILPKDLDFTDDREDGGWFDKAYLNNGNIREDLVLFNWDAIKKDIESRIELI